MRSALLASKNLPFLSCVRTHRYRHERARKRTRAHSHVHKQDSACTHGYMNEARRVNRNACMILCMYGMDKRASLCVCKYADY